jgi:predicted RNA binding protein YcfA (HicA-like mRNA interferase family)
MSALKPIRWQKFEKVLLLLGCEFVRQNGSHRVYRYPDIIRPIIVPAHSTPIPEFIIKNNLRLLGITTKQYKDILKNIK